MKIETHPIIEFLYLYLKNIEKLNKEERNIITKILKSISTPLIIRPDRHLSEKEFKEKFLNKEEKRHEF